MRFYTTERLSAKRARTPEGFLLCEDVPLARTGWMEYNVAELELKPVPGTDTIKVQRTPEVVFDGKTVASYSGKAFVNEHPSDDVTPANWKELSGGTILNPRQGMGEQDDLLLADIMVTCPDMIAMVERNEKTEVSVGYDCDYEEIGPGEYQQKGIIVNHVALVEQGRCGPRCSIGDAKTPTRRNAVAKFSEQVHDYIRRAFKAKDAAELDAIIKDAEKGEVTGGGEEGEQHIHVHLGGGAAPVKDDEEEVSEEGGGEMSELIALLKQFLAKMEGGGGEDKKPKDAEGETAEEKASREKKEKEDKDTKDKEMKDDETIEGKLAMESPPGTDDMARKAKDSAYLADAWQQHVAYAEIISPGARMPTFDSAARPAVTLGKLCGARTALLEHAYTTDEKVRTIVDEINGNRALDFKRMTCDSARTMIAVVAREVGELNNQGATKDFGAYAARQGSGGGIGVRGKIMTPADLNRVAREMYKV